MYKITKLLMAASLLSLASFYPMVVHASSSNYVAYRGGGGERGGEMNRGDVNRGGEYNRGNEGYRGGEYNHPEAYGAARGYERGEENGDVNGAAAAGAVEPYYYQQQQPYIYNQNPYNPTIPPTTSGSANPFLGN